MLKEEQLKKNLEEAFDRSKGDLGRRLQDIEGSEDANGNKRTYVFPSVEEAVKILASRKCNIYIGIDPTGPDIHLGHTIPLLFLKQLTKEKLGGHNPVLLVGDFTARIGDPTGKTTARQPLTDKQIKENEQNYLSQVCKILGKKEDSLDVRHNSKWLAKMTLRDLVDLSSNVTVQQMIQRDMFQERLRNDKPVGVHEFLYPLMQGYDSVAMEIDGEVGGNDQTFNMLVGRDLEKKLLNKDKLVFATQLLVDTTTGKKMSKSEGGLISLSDTPGDMFGKTMAIPDSFIRGMFKLCTEVSMKWIDDNDEDMKARPYDYKKKLAKELVKMYHGEKEAKKAQEEFEKVFSRKKLPTDIMEWKGDQALIVNVLVESGLIISKSEAKRLTDQKAVKVNDQEITDWNYKLNRGDVIRVGSRKFLKII